MNSALFLTSTTDSNFSFQTASTSIAGYDPDSPGKVNQDACFHFATSMKSNNYSNAQPKQQYTQALSSPLFICGGVLDGHGKKGHVLNQFLGYQVPRILEKKLHDAYYTVTTHENTTTSNNNSSSSSSSILEDILIDTFHEAHNAARRNDTVPAARSGTTCVTCIVDTTSGVVYTANVGDSRAILFFQHPKWETKDGTGIPNMESSCDLKTMKYNIVPLSKETTTKDVNERKRIEEAKQGRIDGLGNVW